jgi:hypothetical protein
MEISSGSEKEEGTFKFPHTNTILVVGFFRISLSGRTYLVLLDCLSRALLASSRCCLALFWCWAWLWAYRLTRFNCFVLLPPGLMGLWCFKTKFASPVNVDVCNARTSNCAFMHELLKLDDGNCNHFWQSLQILFFFVTERKICKLMKGWK